VRLDARKIFVASHAFSFSGLDLLNCKLLSRCDRLSRCWDLLRFRLCWIFGARISTVAPLGSNREGRSRSRATCWSSGLTKKRCLHFSKWRIPERFKCRWDTPLGRDDRIRHSRSELSGRLCRFLNKESVLSLRWWRDNSVVFRWALVARRSARS
jgi:hypothetical protein